MPGTEISVQRPDDGMVPAAHDGRADPVGHVEVERRLVDEGDAAVVGHHQVEVDPGPPKLGAETGRGGGEPADRGDR